MAHVFNNGQGGHICDRCRKLMCIEKGGRRRLNTLVTKRIISRKTPSGKTMEFCSTTCANLFFNKLKK